MAYTANLLTRSNLASHSLNGETVYLYGSSWTDAWYGSEPPDNALYELEVGEDGYKWTAYRNYSKFKNCDWYAGNLYYQARFDEVNNPVNSVPERSNETDNFEFEEDDDLQITDYEYNTMY